MKLLKPIALLVFLLSTTISCAQWGNGKKIKGNGLSEEEKRAIYRSAAKETRQKMMTKFSNEDVQKIIDLERESFKK